MYKDVYTFTADVNVTALLRTDLSHMHCIFQLCLEVLDAVLCYSYLPSNMLEDVVAALCCMVNNPKFCQPSWEVSLMYYSQIFVSEYIIVPIKF